MRGQPRGIWKEDETLHNELEQDAPSIVVHEEASGEEDPAEGEKLEHRYAGHGGETRWVL